MTPDPRSLAPQVRRAKARRVPRATLAQLPLARQVLQAQSDLLGLAKLARLDRRAMLDQLATLARRAIPEQKARQARQEFRARPGIKETSERRVTLARLVLVKPDRLGHLEQGQQVLQVLPERVKQVQQVTLVLQACKEFRDPPEFRVFRDPLDLRASRGTPARQAILAH